jgi:hypothetical protein
VEGGGRAPFPGSLLRFHDPEPCRADTRGFPHDAVRASCRASTATGSRARRGSWARAPFPPPPFPQ